MRYVAEAVLSQMVAASERWRWEVLAKGTGHLRAQHAGISQRGWYYVGMFGGIDGDGARAAADGIDCGGGVMTDHNVEWFESQYPFLYLFRRNIKDGGGAGTYRGGVGQELAITLHDAPEGHIKGIPFGVEGPRNSGQGLFGGYPAPPSLLEMRKGSLVDQLMQEGRSVVDFDALGGDAMTLPFREFEITTGDVLFNSNGGGGGYGDPLDRDSNLVAADVEQGLVSPDVARRVYGVELAGHAVDVAGTETLRSRLREERQEGLQRRGRSKGATSEDGTAPQRSSSPNGHDPAPTAHPLRESLEIATHLGAPWVRCARCKRLLCPEGRDWVESCDRKLLSPTSAGPLMHPLKEGFFLEQIYCPSCAVLLNTDVVEATAPLPGRPKGTAPTNVITDSGLRRNRA